MEPRRAADGAQKDVTLGDLRAGKRSGTSVGACGRRPRVAAGVLSHAGLFSSVRRLAERLMAPPNYIAINALALMQITHGSPMFLNPGGGLWQRTTVRGDRVARRRQHVSPGQAHDRRARNQGSAWATEDVPGRTRRRARATFATKKDVKRARLAHIVMPDDAGSGHTLITLDVDGDRSTLCGWIRTQSTRTSRGPSRFTDATSSASSSATFPCRAFPVPSDRVRAGAAATRAPHR
jgi:hypothetical protein